MSLRYTATMTLALLAYGALAAALAARLKIQSCGATIRDGVGKYYRQSCHSDRNPTIICITLPFHTISTLQATRSAFNDFLGSSPPSAWVALLVICVLTVVLLFVAIRIFRGANT